jgi:rubrerythrin
MDKNLVLRNVVASIKDEKMAVVDYGKLAKRFTMKGDKASARTIRHIRKEERQHKKLLSGILKRM